MVKERIITKDDLDENNYYKHSDSLECNDEAILIKEKLGYVKFKKGISSKFYIIAEAGSGIEAGLGIEAGWGIKAGLGIKAGSGIEAGLGIEAGEGIKAGEGIEAGEGIVSFFSGNITAKWISVLRIAVGFNIEEEQEIRAEIRKGTVILGKVVKNETKNR